MLTIFTRCSPSSKHSDTHLLPRSEIGVLLKRLQSLQLLLQLLSQRLLLILLLLTITLITTTSTAEVSTTTVPLPLLL